MKTIANVLLLVLITTAAARAEIEKFSTYCDTGFCFHWWPKLPQLHGWHQDKEQSFQYDINALAPDGSSFTEAEAVMYANATYKPQVPEAKSVEMFIADDQSQFVASDPGITITEVKSLVTGDGLKLHSFTFVPRTKGQWEEVSYGEEGDFYLTFVLSSRSKQGFSQTQQEYRDLVRRYKVKLPDE